MKIPLPLYVLVLFVVFGLSVFVIKAKPGFLKQITDPSNNSQTEYSAEQGQDTFILLGRESVVSCPDYSCNPVNFAYNGEGYFYPHYRGEIMTTATVKEKKQGWAFVEITREAGTVYGESDSPIYFDELIISGWLPEISLIKGIQKSQNQSSVSGRNNQGEIQNNTYEIPKTKVTNPYNLLIPNHFYLDEKTIARDVAIENYWDEIKDYIYGTTYLNVFSYESANYYNLLVDISGGVVEVLYFLNGGILFITGADFDESGHAFGMDLKEGNGWDFYLDMDSSIVENAIYDWASDNSYEVE